MAILNLGRVAGDNGRNGTNGVDGGALEVTVVLDTPQEYVLDITTRDGTIRTPNLRGATGADWGTIPIVLTGPQVQEIGHVPYFVRLDNSGSDVVLAIMIDGELEYFVITNFSALPSAAPVITALSAVWDDGETTIAWNVASNYVHHFTITGRSGTVDIAPTQTGWTTELPQSSQITFTVTDIAGRTVSQTVDVSGVQPPPLITNLTARKTYGASTVHVSWDVSSTAVDHYEITYLGATYDIAGSATYYDAAIADGTAVSLKAIDAWGQEGTAAAQVVYLPPVPVIDNFTAANPDSGTAYLRWHITSQYLASIGIAWPGYDVTLSPEATTFSDAIPVDTVVMLSATDSYGQTTTATATVADVLPIVYPAAKDIGVKFGLTAPSTGHGYTAADVAAITETLHKYAARNWLAGNFAVGDYFDLDTFETPTTTVQDAAGVDMEVLAESYTNEPVTNANYSGYTLGAMLRFHIESVDGYYDKNDNYSHHLVFRAWGHWYRARGAYDDHTGRMNNSATATGGWAASGAKAFLNGPFLTALGVSGVPAEYIMETKRTVSTSATAAAVDTSKIFLATEWEEYGERVVAPEAENDGTQIHFGTVPVGESMAHTKTPLDSLPNGNWGHHWLASVTSAANFCRVNGGYGESGGTGANRASGWAPSFCIW
jgi:hypothetical protein